MTNKTKHRERPPIAPAISESTIPDLEFLNTSPIDVDQVGGMSIVLSIKAKGSALFQVRLPHLAIHTFGHVLATQSEEIRRRLAIADVATRISAARQKPQSRSPRQSKRKR